ncbi:MAG: hypothetical protein IK016_06990 [Lachnospiraceae bacterium]|nr:hypothetical protein [Lachnospiraceae bacterium]
MKRILFSPQVFRKLELTKAHIAESYDKQTAERIMRQIVKTINRLKKNPYIGTSVAAHF